MPYANPDALVSTEWLARHLDAPDLRIVDGTYTLPGVTPTAKELYAQRHLPGAVFFDIDDIADEHNPLPHMLPSAEKFAQRMRRLGLGDGHKIVIYDGTGLATAARPWWMLRVFGHRDVAILDGGLPKWQAEGRPVTDDVPAPRERHFTAQLNTLLVRDKAQLLDNLASRREQVLDARARGRFAGTAKEPRGGLRSGHIPGSLNLPYEELIDPTTRTVLPAEELAKRFAAAGLERGKPVVTSCGSGVTACVLAFGLYLLGWPDAAVYDGSWSEWGLPGDTPVETGAG
ncbi:MAG TPA: 3-mercaptopyruvate sulfurtransferase [Stellaceae bacterium]|nr:3-mercaptopyruvate sulfurtransferase [Stellaceae bacterium]